jgi:multiple sugar transport system substrate-binding protein
VTASDDFFRLLAKASFRIALQIATGQLGSLGITSRHCCLERQHESLFFQRPLGDGRVAFATGKVAMYMAGAWFGGEMKASFPDINGKWDVAPLPEGPEGCATTLAGDALVIFDASENQDAAWLWMEFLSRPENMKLWTYGSKTSTLLPPRQSLLDDPELTKFNPWLQGFADNMECAVTSNVVQEKWSEIEWGPLNQNLGQAIYGEISPEEALDNAAQEGEEILAGTAQ